jgi:hypothetical protein
VSTSIEVRYFLVNYFSILTVGGEHVLLIKNLEWTKINLKKPKDQGESKSNSTLTLFHTLGLVHTEIDALDTYRMCFLCFYMDGKIRR